jgi:DNA-directed RNA polymerase I, II, and III subunit RPABC2
MPSNTMKLLALEPDQTLYFRKSPNSATAPELLKLTNKSTGYVAFKVKTTAPKSYLVRPSTGVLKAGATTEVQIILQQPGQGADTEANLHRFLVQAVPSMTGAVPTREDWADWQSRKDLIQEQKLSVLLDACEGDAMAKPVDDASRTTNAGHSEDLQVKYDELVRFTLDLEKQKKKLEESLGALQSSKGGPSSSARRGYSTFHLILVAVLSFLLSYVGPSPFSLAPKVAEDPRPAGNTAPSGAPSGEL